MQSQAAQRKSAEINATLSSVCGFLGEVTLTDSAIIILLAGLLGAGDMLSIISTSFLPLFFGLLVFPMALLANRIGVRRLIHFAIGVSAVAYFVAASSPFFESYAKEVLIGSIIAFSLSLSGFVAGWFPLADSFLTEDRRILFFSRMRFCNLVLATTFLGLSGMFVGEQTPTWKLQTLLYTVAVIYAGRLFFMKRVPSVFTGRGINAASSLRSAFFHAAANRPLVGFSLYIFAVNLAAYGTVPLTLLYLKRSLQAPDNVVVFTSAMALLGMLAGYLSIRRLVRRIGVRGALLLFHGTFAVVNLTLFFIGEGNMLVYALIGGLVMSYNFMIASASVVVAGEMMALAHPGERVISMAFFSAFYFGGFGFSRLATSLVLGSGLLAAEWQIYSLKFTHYQTLFLLFTVFLALAAIFLLIVPAIFSGRAAEAQTDQNSMGDQQGE